MFNGKIHYKWPFSIAMLNYQRVICVIFVPLVFLHLLGTNRLDFGCWPSFWAAPPRVDQYHHVSSLVRSRGTPTWDNMSRILDNNHVPNFSKNKRGTNRFFRTGMKHEYKPPSKHSMLYHLFFVPWFLVVHPYLDGLSTATAFAQQTPPKRSGLCEPEMAWNHQRQSLPPNICYLIQWGCLIS